MLRFRIYVILAGIFIATSCLLYLVHYYIFRDEHHIFIFMLGDLAFLSLEVFLVMVVIERLLVRREKQALRHKLNMVIGAFFSEVGTELLKRLLNCFRERDEISRKLAIGQNWTRAEFRKAVRFAATLHYQPDCRMINLDELHAFLKEKRPFLLRLLENPNLLEHEHFTDTLWAAFHLIEELEARESLKDLPEADLNHITADIELLYASLIVEWLAYVEHLQSSYPFLFSLVSRTHPFQAHPTAVVSE